MSSNRRRRRNFVSTDPTEALTRTTQLVIAGLRHFGNDDETVRSKVRESFQEAVTGDKLDTKQLDFGHGPELAISTPGLFRMIFARFGIDRSDLHAQERWWSVVEGAMEWELKRKGAKG